MEVKIHIKEWIETISVPDELMSEEVEDIVWDWVCANVQYSVDYDNMEED